jgi:hypothetical protein
VLVETDMASPAEFEDLAGQYRDAGYRVVVYLLAVPAAWSMLDAAAEHLQAVQGGGSGLRFSRSSHDAGYNGLRRAALAVDAGGVANEVFVVDRAGETIYENEADPDGRWSEPGATRALDAERARIRTPEEYQQFNDALAAERERVATLQPPAPARAPARLQRKRQLAEQFYAGWRRELDHIAEQAAPVRPSPDLLTEAEIDRIFHEQVVEGRLAGKRRQDSPAVFFLGGPAGPSTEEFVQELSDLRWARDAVRVRMGDFAAYHPGYAGMLGAGEEDARRRAAPLSRALWERAHEYAIAHGNHVLVETDMASPAEFEDLVGQYRDAGYRVVVYLLAVPAAWSMLGAAARRPQSVQAARSSHDAGYDGVRRAAAAVDAGGIADAVAVVRGDGEPVYSGQGGLGGAAAGLDA